MKPNTEDFLIPMADAIRLFVNTEDVDFVQSATKARIHAAILAKAAHDEECQRLADEWVEQNKTAFLAEFESYRRWAAEVRYPHGHRSKDFLEYLESEKNRMWSKILPNADPIFRDYINETPPTA